jgi:endonuclease YncB( thermonuclease family)
VLAGPYFGRVERVVDGDTIAVTVDIWLQQSLEVLVRVRGIDAPEVRGDCDLERIRAAEATAALQRLVSAGEVRLTEIEGDKFHGRVVADVTTREGADVGRELIEAGLARRYDGGARQGWCAVGSIDTG